MPTLFTSLKSRVYRLLVSAGGGARANCAIHTLLPGVLGNVRSAAEDSFSDGLLEGPSYTRPEVWRELAVPDVLRSGNYSKTLTFTLSTTAP